MQNLIFQLIWKEDSCSFKMSPFCKNFAVDFLSYEPRNSELASVATSESEIATSELGTRNLEVRSPGARLLGTHLNWPRTVSFTFKYWSQNRKKLFFSSPHYHLGWDTLFQNRLWVLNWIRSKIGVEQIHFNCFIALVWINSLLALLCNFNKTKDRLTDVKKENYGLLQKFNLFHDSFLYWIFSKTRTILN